VRSPAGRAIVWILAAAVSAAGVWLSYELTVEHLKLPRNEPSFLEEACLNLKEWSCEQVSESKYGVFPFGAAEDDPHLPTAELGVFYFTAVLCWLLLIGRCSRSRWWAHLILAAGTAIGLGSSIFLDVVMWTQVDKPCPLCLATHVGALLLFASALLLWPREPRAAAPAGDPDQPVFVASEALFTPAPKAPPSREPWPHWWMLVVTPIVAVLAIGMEFLYLRPQAGMVDLTPEVQELEKKLKTAEYYRDDFKKKLDHYDRRWQHNYWAWRLSPRVEIPLEGEPVLGPANAVHTIVIYSDFQCPHCKEFEDYVHDTIIPIAQTRGGAKLIFKHWPICTDCNPHAYHNSHPLACKASLAAEAARIVGGDRAFWRMYDLLWKGQAQWKKTESFVELARQIGLDEQAFEKAMDGDEAMARIKAHIEEGANLGKGTIKEERRDFVKVDSTPSVYINNKRVWRMPKNKLLWSTILSTPPSPPPERPPATGPQRGTRSTSRPAVGSTRSRR